MILQKKTKMDGFTQINIQELDLSLLERMTQFSAESQMTSFLKFLKDLIFLDYLVRKNGNLQCKQMDGGKE